MMFDLKKTWMYSVRATPEQCEAAFQSAFSEKRSFLSKNRAHWSISRQSVESDSGAHAPGLVATMDRANALRGLSREGQTVGSSIAFTIDSTEGGVTQCQMFLLEGRRIKKNNITPAYVANSDILKAHMKTAHRKLTALDPNARHHKTR